MEANQSRIVAAASCLAACWLMTAAGAGMAAAQTPAFPCGIACGDVTESSAVLWTAGPESLSVQVSEVADFSALSGSAAPLGESPPDRAEAAAPSKFLVGGLAPDRIYYYRFVQMPDTSTGGAAISPTGRFRTLPNPDEPAALRFAFSGDSNFAYAPFTLLSSAAEEDAAFFIWFGDTVYADVTAGGVSRAVTLDEYRAKYQQVRADPHVQALSTAMPTIVGWDDHEVENDYAGADPELSTTQRDDAYRAFFEYMPIAEVADDPFRTYRSFRFGANVEFFLLDGRQYREASARDACHGHPDPTGYVAGPIFDEPDCAPRLSAPRTMLGAQQLGWLLDGLLASTAKTKFVVTSVPLQFLGIFPYDRWDGYDFERRTILEFIANNAIDGVIFLTTDFHGNFYNPDVMAYFRRYRPDYALAAGSAAPELIVGPIGQETFQETLSELRSAIVARVPTPVVNELLNVVEVNVYSQLRKVSGVTFVQPDRLAYAVFEVTADGDVSFTLKGTQPRADSIAGVSPPATAFFRTDVTDAETPGGAFPCCALPIAFGLTGFALCALLPRRARTGRRRRPAPD